METIKKQFQVFGFQPIETPSFENSDTLMGKYGEEGDRLIFKILNSGNYLEKYYSTIQKISDEIVFALNRYQSEKNRNYNNLPQIISELTKKMTDLIKKNFTDLNDKDRSRIFGPEFINSIIEASFVNSKLKKQGDLDDESIKALSRELFSNYILGINSLKITSEISEKALRYDLTVPFARYVVQHQNDIAFPFKRYQIQPVWRADRPQKGRFREFFQCDADVVGSKSLWQEVEFVQLYDAVFSALQLEGVTIKINNRKILSGIAEVIGAQDKLIDFTVALDKLDKIGEDKVKEEMLNKGIPQSGIDKLQPLFSLKGDFATQIESLKTILITSEVGLRGIEELEFINSAITELRLKTAKLQLDVTLARGLNYYTGAIFEVSAPEGVKMGSIGGGGRYDDLTGIFGMKDVSGVGISFGLDRIYLVLEELGLFPATITESTKVLFINFGSDEALACLKAVNALRTNGVKAELYPDAAKMKKQMNYANRRGIPFVVLVGDEELKTNTFTLKDMSSGEQSKVSLSQLIDQF